MFWCKLTEDEVVSFCVSLLEAISPVVPLGPLASVLKLMLPILPISASKSRLWISSSLSVCDEDSDELLPEPLPSYSQKKKKKNYSDGQFKIIKKSCIYYY